MCIEGTECSLRRNRSKQTRFTQKTSGTSSSRQSEWAVCIHEVDVPFIRRYIFPPIPFWKLGTSVELISPLTDAVLLSVLITAIAHCLEHLGSVTPVQDLFDDQAVIIIQAPAESSSIITCMLTHTDPCANDDCSDIGKV